MCCDTTDSCSFFDEEKEEVFSVGGFTVSRSVGPSIFEDPNVLYIAGAGTVGILMVAFYRCAKRGSKGQIEYESLAQDSQ